MDTSNIPRKARRKDTRLDEEGFALGGIRGAAEAKDILHVINWKTVAQDQTEWQKLIDEARTHHWL